MNHDTTFTDAAKFVLVWNALHTLGVDVCVSFSGSGDSGQIDDIAPVAAPPYDEQASKAFNAYKITLVEGEPPVELAKLIEELSDPITTNEEIDWWNNDGGNGELIWQRAFTHEDGTEYPDMLRLTINQARIEYETFDFEYGRFGTEIEE
jgi:hypothetical protein